MQTLKTENPLGYEKISKLMMKYSGPAIASFLVAAIYNIVDQVFIGRGIPGYEGIGVLGIAATNIVFPLLTISTALSVLIGVGTAANFNLRLGSGNREAAAKVAGNGILLMTAVGIAVVTLSLLFSHQLLVLFGVTDEIYAYTEAYMKIICIGLPFQIFLSGACQLIRSDGSPTISMIAIASGAILNIILDPIFIYVLDMGMAGAAIATVIGQIVSALMALYYVIFKFKSIKFNKNCFKPLPSYMSRITALGAAACINQISMALVQIVMNNTLRYYGANSVYGSEIPLACVGAISKINIIFLAFVIGMSQGCQPIFGFNYGAKKYARVKQTYITAMVVATIFSTLIFFVFQLFPNQVMAIFGEGSPEYFAFSARYLRVFMMLICINGIQPVTSGYFTSIGKAKVGILLSLTRQVIFLLPLLLILPLIFGIDGVVYAGPISDGAAFLLAAVFIVKEIKNLNMLEKEMLT
ncbi:MAG: MATE family efflux transporter [Oscillospiraceae bacterium]|nr:MATE family efflux transporter [Oscillospiraceae bacterium]